MKYWIKYTGDTGFNFHPIYIYENGKKVQVDFANPTEAIKQTILSLWIHDSDHSGEDEYIATIHDEANNYSYFIVDHSWWWSDECLENDFCISQELSYDELTDEDKKKVFKDRDWVQLSRFSHKEWPREI